MDLPYYLLLPFLAAFIFALASMGFKKAFAIGAGLTRAFFVNNIIIGVALLPLFLLDSRPLSWGDIHRPVMAGVAFFCGHLANFLAIRAGDVSLVTPLLGSKVIFVALLSALFFHIPLSPGHWLATLLTVLGVFILGITEIRTSQKLLLTTVLALISGLFFALCDLLIQRWAKGFGTFHFLPLTFLTVAVLSFVLVPYFREPLSSMPKTAWKWLGIAALLTSVQVFLITATIAVFLDATGVNVVYSTRGLWGIVLVWFIGSWFDNTERHTVGRRLMLWRAAGAVLMVVAVILTVRASHGRQGNEMRAEMRQNEQNLRN